MMSFLEKLQKVNNYKMNANSHKVQKNTDSNNSYDAKEKDVVRKDIVTDVKICVSR